MSKFFTLTEQHIKLLQHMQVGWQKCEFGAPEIDPKRPYGNSSVISDMYYILEGKELDEEVLEEQGIDYDDFMDELYERYIGLHEETKTALQIVLRTGKFESGKYTASLYQNDWKKI